jgi:hypothetical protein
MLFTNTAHVLEMKYLDALLYYNISNLQHHFAVSRSIFTQCIVLLLLSHN